MNMNVIKIGIYLYLESSSWNDYLRFHKVQVGMLTQVAMLINFFLIKLWLFGYVYQEL